MTMIFISFELEVVEDLTANLEGAIEDIIEIAIFISDYYQDFKKESCQDGCMLIVVMDFSFGFNNLDLDKVTKVIVSKQ